MARARDLRSTIEDFIASDDGTDTRHELHAGHVVTTAPATQAHNELVVRPSIALSGGRSAPCRVLAGPGGTVRDRAKRYSQADLVVTCEERRRGQLWVETPLVVGEVPSPSTAATAFERKLPDYRRLAFLQHTEDPAAAGAHR